MVKFSVYLNRRVFVMFVIAVVILLLLFVCLFACFSILFISRFACVTLISLTIAVWLDQ